MSYRTFTTASGDIIKYTIGKSNVKFVFSEKESLVVPFTKVLDISENDVQIAKKNGTLSVTPFHIKKFLVRISKDKEAE